MWLEERKKEMSYKHVEGRNKYITPLKWQDYIKEVQDINRKFIKNNNYVHQHIYDNWQKVSYIPKNKSDIQLDNILKRGFK